MFKYCFSRNCSHQMTSPKCVENSEKRRGNPKNTDIPLLRYPSPKLPRETSPQSFLTVKDNPGPVWTPGFFKPLGWKTSTPLMTPFQLTTVPLPPIPEQSPVHPPTFYMTQLALQLFLEICILTMERTEHTPPMATPSISKTVTAFLGFPILR